METTSHATRKREAAFTLVEMLMVIGVLAFLMAAFGVLLVGTQDRQKRDSTRAFLEKLGSGVKKFEQTFSGQGVPPNVWPDDVGGGGVTPGGGLSMPGEADPTLDGSSKFLAFWLGYHFLVWRKTSPDGDRSPILIKPAVTDLTPFNIRLAADPSVKKSTEVKTYLEQVQDATNPIVIGKQDAAEDGKRVAEIPVWEFDLSDTGEAYYDTVKELIDKIVIVDAWGRPIRYLVGRDENNAPIYFRIVSAGEDGEWNTGDDIAVGLTPLAGVEE